LLKRELDEDVAMDIEQALEILKRSKVDLGEEANDALDLMCNYVHDKLQEYEDKECFHCWDKEARIGDDGLCGKCREADNEARRM
jgi:hypothetical protein